MIYCVVTRNHMTKDKVCHLMFEKKKIPICFSLFFFLLRMTLVRMGRRENAFATYVLLFSEKKSCHKRHRPHHEGPTILVQSFIPSHHIGLYLFYGQTQTKASFSPLLFFYGGRKESVKGTVSQMFIRRKVLQNVLKAKIILNSGHFIARSRILRALFKHFMAAKIISNPDKNIPFDVGKFSPTFKGFCNKIVKQS